MKIPSSFILCGLLLISVAACDKTPTNKLVDPLQSGAVPVSPTTFPIYTEEIMTGGGVALIPGGKNQSLEMDNNSAPTSGYRQIFYSWNGQDVDQGTTTEHTFAGFQLMLTDTQAALTGAQAKDLSSYGYNALEVWVRGTLSNDTYLRINGPDDLLGSEWDVDHTNWIELSGADLSANTWKKFVVPLTAGKSGACLSALKIYTTITIQYNQPGRTTAPGSGGTVYVDNISYVKTTP